MVQKTCCHEDKFSFFETKFVGEANALWSLLGAEIMQPDKILTLLSYLDIFWTSFGSYSTAKLNVENTLACTEIHRLQ